jgi:hypothetical protein
MDDKHDDGLNRREVLATFVSATLLAGAASPAAAQSDDNKRRSARTTYPPSDPKLFKEIDAVLKHTEEIWAAQEWWRLPDEIWDREDTSPIYVAEELYDVMVGWEILDKYIFPPKKGLDAFRWGYSNLFVKELAPGVALALYDHWFEIKIKAPGPIGVPRHGFDRVLSIYNLRDDGWRQSLYAQCPLGPDTYVRAMAEKLVQPDFDEFYERVKKMKIQDPRLKKEA